MLEKVQSLWNFRLIRLSGDDSILVSQVVLVVAILVIGYFASKFLERLIERRLAQTSVTADAGGDARHGNRA